MKDMFDFWQKLWLEPLNKVLKLSESLREGLFSDL